MEKLSFAVDTATTMAYMRNASSSSPSSSPSSSSSNSSSSSSSAPGVGGSKVEGKGDGAHVDPISRPYLAWAVQDFHLSLVESAMNGGYIQKVLRDIDRSNNGASHTYI